MQTLLAALERAIEQLMKQYGGGNTTRPGGGDQVELPRQPPARPQPQPPTRFPSPPERGQQPHPPIFRPSPFPFPPNKGGPVAEPKEPPIFKWPFPKTPPEERNPSPGIPRGGACGASSPPEKGRTGGTLGNMQ